MSEDDPKPRGESPIVPVTRWIEEFDGIACTREQLRESEGRDLTAESVRQALEYIEAEAERLIVGPIHRSPTTSSEPLTVETLEELRRSLPKFARVAFGELAPRLDPWQLEFLERRMLERPFSISFHVGPHAIAPPRWTFLYGVSGASSSPPLVCDRRLPRKLKKALGKWPADRHVRERRRVARWKRRSGIDLLRYERC